MRGISSSSWDRPGISAPADRVYSQWFSGFAECMLAQQARRARHSVCRVSENALKASVFEEVCASIVSMVRGGLVSEKSLRLSRRGFASVVSIVRGGLVSEEEFTLASQRLCQVSRSVLENSVIRFINVLEEVSAKVVSLLVRRDLVSEEGLRSPRRDSGRTGLLFKQGWILSMGKLMLTLQRLVYEKS